jgi:hypothetical protein
MRIAFWHAAKPYLFWRVMQAFFCVSTVLLIPFICSSQNRKVSFPGRSPFKGVRGLLSLPNLRIHFVYRLYTFCIHLVYIEVF